MRTLAGNVAGPNGMSLSGYSLIFTAGSSSYTAAIGGGGAYSVDLQPNTYSVALRSPGKDSERIMSRLQVTDGPTVGLLELMGADSINANMLRVAAAVGQSPEYGGGGGSGAGVDAEDVGFDIWLLAGQSNMRGHTTLDANVDIPYPGVFQWGSLSSDAPTFNRIVLGSDPLRMPESTVAGRTGPGSWFGRTIKAMVPTNRYILLVPYAWGGTALAINNAPWRPGNPGGSMYEGAITQSNGAVAAAQLIYPDSRFKGVLWIQGEADGEAAIGHSVYAAALAQLIAGFRTRITGAADSAFIIGSLVPEAISTNSGVAVIAQAQQDVVANTSKCAFAPGVSGYSTDNWHYDVLPGPRIMGSRLAGAVLEAVGTITPVAPVIIDIPQVAGTAEVGGTLTAGAGKWQNLPTELQYQWQRDGVAISGATSRSYVVVEADANTALRVSVTAVNAAGQAVSQSAPVSIVVARQRNAHVTSGTSYFTSETLGPVLGKEIKIAMLNIDTTGSPFFFSQGGSTSTSRELALLRNASAMQCIIGGSVTTLMATTAVIPPGTGAFVDIDMVLTMSLVAGGTWSIKFGDYDLLTKDIPTPAYQTGSASGGATLLAGTGNIPNMPFRLGARGGSNDPLVESGGGTFPVGSRFGDTLVWTRDTPGQGEWVLQREFWMPASGTVAVDQVAGKNATLVNGDGTDFAAVA